MKQIIRDNNSGFYGMLVAIETDHITSVNLQINYNNELTTCGVAITTICGNQYFIPTGLTSEGYSVIIHARNIITEWVRTGKINLEGVNI